MSNYVTPQVGQIWKKNPQGRGWDCHIHERVRVVFMDDDIVYYDYVPHIKTSCSRSLESFLQFYELDEVFLAKRIIEFYEGT